MLVDCLDAAGVNSDAEAVCLGVLDPKREFVKAGCDFAAAGASGALASAGFGANSELVADGFGAAAAKSEVLDDDVVGFRVSGALA